jgi:hypothetical protein
VTLNTLSTVLPKTYTLEMDVTVTQSAVAAATKKFAKADPTIESKLNVCQDDMLFTSEEHMWKLLLPIVKVRPQRPSKELLVVPALEVREVPVMSNILVWSSI